MSYTEALNGYSKVTNFTETAMLVIVGCVIILGILSFFSFRGVGIVVMVLGITTLVFGFYAIGHGPILEKDWEAKYGEPYLQSLPEHLVDINDFYLIGENSSDLDLSKEIKEPQLVKIIYTEKGIKREVEVYAYLKESTTKSNKYGWRVLKKRIGTYNVKGKYLHTVYYSKE